MSNSVADFRASPAPRPEAGTSRPLFKSDDVRELVEPLQSLIVQYPGTALASAFLIGVAIAWWIKRR